MNLDKFDTILYCDPNIEDINEDSRTTGNRVPSATYVSGTSQNPDYIDPMLYSAFSFGNTLRQSLNNMGDGFSASVTDFKKWVVVDVKYHNTITGRYAGKTFLIIFQNKGNGIVLSTHNKWRTISGVSQASSYIRSASNALRNETNQNL